MGNGQLSEMGGRGKLCTVRNEEGGRTVQQFEYSTVWDVESSCIRRRYSLLYRYSTVWLFLSLNGECLANLKPEKEMAKK